MSVRQEIERMIFHNPAVLDVLDSLVHETASQRASAINNNGLKAQLEFLDGEGLDEDRVLQHLEESIAP